MILGTLRNEWRETNRLIGRERLRLDPGKLVPVRLFEECFTVGSAPGRPTVLDRLARALHLEDIGEERIGLSVIIPRSLLSEADRAHHDAATDRYTGMLRERLAELRKLETDAIQSNDPHALYSLALQDSLEDNIKRRIESGSDRSRVRTCYLGDLVREASGALLPGAPLFFPLATALSVMKGQGRVMVDFWRAVNGLEDYSHLFPRRGPGGGKGEKVRERQGAGVLVPVPGAAGVR